MNDNRHPFQPPGIVYLVGGILTCVVAYFIDHEITRRSLPRMIATVVPVGLVVGGLAYLITRSVSRRNRSDRL